MEKLTVDTSASVFRPVFSSPVRPSSKKDWSNSWPANATARPMNVLPKTYHANSKNDKVLDKAIAGFVQEQTVKVGTKFMSLTKDQIRRTVTSMWNNRTPSERGQFNPDVDSEAERYVLYNLY